MDSYSETISSNDESIDDRMVATDSDSSATMDFEEIPCEWEANSKGIEATLHQIATGLQSAAGGCLAIASNISKVEPYELPQVIDQIPPPPMDVPISIRKALLIDGENKSVNYLLCREYELNKTSWSKLRKKYRVSRNKICAAFTGKGRPGGSQYRQKRKQMVKPGTTASTSNFKIVND